VRVVRTVKAVYPQTARDKKIQGVARLDIVIGTDGKVLQAHALSGDLLLAEAAVEAVRKWVYEPTLVNGEPVEVAMFVDIVFLLNR
jgi:protein TonB